MENMNTLGRWLVLVLAMAFSSAGFAHGGEDHGAEAGEESESLVDDDWTEPEGYSVRVVGGSSDERLMLFAELKSAAGSQRVSLAIEWPDSGKPQGLYLVGPVLSALSLGDEESEVNLIWTGIEGPVSMPVKRKWFRVHEMGDADKHFVTENDGDLEEYVFAGTLSMIFLDPTESGHF